MRSAALCGALVLGVGTGSLVARAAPVCSQDSAVRLEGCLSISAVCGEGRRCCVREVTSCATGTSKRDCEKTESGCVGCTSTSDCRAVSSSCPPAAPGLASCPEESTFNCRDDDCDGLVDEGLVAPPCTGSSVGECNPGTPVCKDGHLECAGKVTPQAEECNGLDDDCDNETDEDCVEPAWPAECADRSGAPVNMVTGNMSLGPLELASVAAGSGPPLRLTMAYNSRDLRQGRQLGIGWTLNLEQRVEDLGARRRFWSERGIPSDFDEAAAPRVEELFLDKPMPVGPTSRALDGANLGLYFAEYTVPVDCPQQDICGRSFLEPRVALEDGTTLLFSETGALRRVRHLSGVEQRVTGTASVEQQLQRDVLV